MTNLSLTAKQSRCKVSGRVNGVSRIVTKADANGQDGQADEERDELLADLHVVPVRDGADAEEEKARAYHLVPHPAPQGQMMTRIGSEDGRSVRSNSVAASIMLIPHQGVPVDQEHSTTGQECSQVLGSDVVRHLGQANVASFVHKMCDAITTDLAPGKLAESGEGHCDGGVDVTP